MSDPMTRRKLPRNIGKGTKLPGGWFVKERIHGTASSAEARQKRVYLFVFEREVEGKVEVMQEWFSSGQTIEVIV